MPGDKRRTEIIKQLKKSDKPLSGTALGKIHGVSRQVIVQDIALIRATGLDVIATARGYVLYDNPDKKKTRVILVKHNYEDIEDELNTIVDFGAVVRNVIIDHPIYGEMVGNMMLENRADVSEFAKDIGRFDTYPLMNLTHGIHMHTIEARDDETLDKIIEKLNDKGYLYTG